MLVEPRVHDRLRRSAFAETFTPSSPEITVEGQIDCGKRRRLRYLSAVAIAMTAIILVLDAMRPPKLNLYEYGRVHLIPIVHKKIAVGKMDTAEALLNEYGSRLISLANSTHGAAVCSQPPFGPKVCDSRAATSGDTTALMAVYSAYRLAQLQLMHARAKR